MESQLTSDDIKEFHKVTRVMPNFKVQSLEEAFEADNYMDLLSGTFHSLDPTVLSEKGERLASGKERIGDQ